MKIQDLKTGEYFKVKSDSNIYKFLGQVLPGLYGATCNQNEKDFKKDTQIYKVKNYTNYFDENLKKRQV